MPRAEILRVSLATIGRFHTFDLAEELDRDGHLAEIFTGFPTRIFRNTRVPPSLIRSAPYVATPVAYAHRIGVLPDRLYVPLSRWAHIHVDRYAARQLTEAHVYSALSGVGLHSGREARRRGMAHVCDRGSTHIVEQDRLLAEEHAAQGLPYRPIDPKIIDIHLQEYAEADAITVPSTFAVRSFEREGVAPEKLHLVPYGVDVSRFSASRPRDAQFTVLFVGGLSVRKGLSYLLDAFRTAAISNARLVLVGADLPETETLLSRHPVETVDRTGPLPQPTVAEWMSRAHVLVLPSVEDGFGLVMAQAMACGCPVIASTNTGAEDLFDDGAEGFVVPVRSPDAIADRLTRLVEDSSLWRRMSDAALARTARFGGWSAYGRQSIDLFSQLARAKGHDIRTASAT